MTKNVRKSKKDTSNVQIKHPSIFKQWLFSVMFRDLNEWYANQLGCKNMEIANLKERIKYMELDLEKNGTKLLYTNLTSLH